MSTVTRASLDQKLALAKRCSRGLCMHKQAFLKRYVLCTLTLTDACLYVCRGDPCRSQGGSCGNYRLRDSYCEFHFIPSGPKSQLFFHRLIRRILVHAYIGNNSVSNLRIVSLRLLQLASVRMLPWAKANINPTGQALIISTVAGMAYFIAADKKILSLARRHSFEGAPEHLRNTSFQGTGRPHPAFFRP